VRHFLGHWFLVVTSGVVVLVGLTVRFPGENPTAGPTLAALGVAGMTLAAVSALRAVARSAREDAEGDR
jgi:hypothetical protein